jgi:hypothetical protein
LREFVLTITEGGGGWAIIAPGTVCTGFTKGGACNQGDGKADPHYCSPECHNQLLIPHGDGMASVIVDAMETLDYMIEQLKQADESDEPMLIAQFGGQVKNLLHQWKEVDRHYKDKHESHPIVNKYLSNVVLLP